MTRSTEGMSRPRDATSVAIRIVRSLRAHGRVRSWARRRHVRGSDAVLAFLRRCIAFLRRCIAFLRRVGRQQHCEGGGMVAASGAGRAAHPALNLLSDARRFA